MSLCNAQSPRPTSTAHALKSAPCHCFFYRKVAKNPSVSAMFFHEYGLSWLSMCAWGSFPILSNPSGSNTQCYKICSCGTGPRADLIALVTKQQYRWSWTQSTGWPASLVVTLTLFVWPFQWTRPLEELKNASSSRCCLWNTERPVPSIRLNIRIHRLSNGSSSWGKSLPLTDRLTLRPNLVGRKEMELAAVYCSYDH